MDPGPAPVEELSGPRAALPNTQRRLLDALATLRTLRVDPAHRDAVAAVARYRPTSGGVRDGFARLAEGGLIAYVGDGRAALTPDGAALARPDARAHAGTVADAWLSVLDERERRILRALLAAHPTPLHRTALAERAGYTETSGGFRGAIAMLGRLGAVVIPEPNHVALAEAVIAP